MTLLMTDEQLQQAVRLAGDSDTDGLQRLGVNVLGDIVLRSRLADAERRAESAEMQWSNEAERHDKTYQISLDINNPATWRVERDAARAKLEIALVENSHVQAEFTKAHGDWCAQLATLTAQRDQARLHNSSKQSQITLTIGWDLLRKSRANAMKLLLS